MLEFFYKNISIAHFLGNIHKWNYTKILSIIFWLDITKLFLALWENHDCFCDAPFLPINKLTK